jgi:N-dimethylarginine dimethylaminohydrolase
MNDGLSPMSEVGRLERLVLKHARDAFRTPEAVADEWRALHFTGPPDIERAAAEYDELVAALTSGGTEVHFLPAGSGVGLDSVYVRDASVATPAGMVLGRMGKAARAGEPEAQARAFRDWGIPVLGAIESPGRLEGGDVVWLDDRTVAVGLGYRTNEAGLRQFRSLLGDSIDTCLAVALPHWHGPDDVFHLMSIVSPVDRDLAVGYSPLMPVPFRQALVDRGYRLVEVPDEEFESMGANVLAVGPRRCIAVEGNPRTRQRLEQAGAEVHVYRGEHISLKGGGGPTCLTRPVQRGRL